MISRTHRFHGYNSLRYVYQQGATVRGQYSALKYVNNPKRTTYRAAVVVGRKVHKSAVVRNRLRRRIYEVMRLQETDINKPYDLVFTVFDEKLNDVTPTQLHKLIQSQLQKAGVVGVKLAPTDSTLSEHAIVDERKR
jgi:ribonuclease P protein component